MATGTGVTGTGRTGRGMRGRGGFRQASSLLQPRIRAAGEARGFAVSRLLTHWHDIVGPEIAAMARPLRVGYGRGGFGATLTLLTSGAQAPLVQMHLPRIREKVNACYGYNAISRISLTQTAPDGLAEGAAPFQPAPSQAGRPTDPDLDRRAAEAAGDVRDPALRDALETLARNVLSRTARNERPPR